MTDLPRWGVVSTIKAPLAQILDFAAWHLDLGADRIYVYLDESAPDTLGVLNAHPAIRALHTDADWWAKRKGRPDKHQVRQSLNARHANNRKPEVEWLVHIDVDEFILPHTPVSEQLSVLPRKALCARVRPVEALAPLPGSDPVLRLFKAFHLDQMRRQAASEACFPTYGPHLSGGFLSHVAGKLFFRTGLKGLQIKIHNVILNGEQNPGEVALTGIELGHFHAADWEHFLSAYRFRLQKGSYRAELKPQVRRSNALNLHDFLTGLEARGGTDALRAFFEEVCTATPALCDRLRQEGVLRGWRMDFREVRERHFPGLGS